MSKVEYIDLKQCIMEDNDVTADEVRQLTKQKNIFLWNIMSSPGSGKTTFITEVISRIKDQYKVGVIEADIESTWDSEKIAALGIKTVQLRTGGGCHLEASMVKEALSRLPLDELNVVIVENVGNLVCPAEFDIGADHATMILSVPEGDDKAIKYPLMFTVTQSLVISKIDVLDYFDFDFERLKKNTQKLNSKLQMFPLSAKTKKGMDEFIQYLKIQISNKLN